ncbi:MAG: type II CRISPR RNA-guided endonuclease Cas9 [Tenacibaculum sp.]
MKRILGLDLGTNSIGWALVNEAEKSNETSSIVKLGVRVNPLTIDEKTNFEKGRPFSVNADRTLKRGARRNLQRFKQRRKNLLEILKKHHVVSDSFVLAEEGKGSTYGILNLRAKAAVEKVSLEELAKVFFTINKKRGYKSSRKAKNEEDGNAIDGMAIAKELYETQTTPGAYVFNLLVKANKKNRKVAIPDFYRSDLQNEFDKVWNYQKQFYPDVLDEELYKALENQGQQNSRKRFLAIKGIYTAENKGKREAIKLQHYKWRTLAVNEQLTIEEVAYVLVEINNNLNKSSGYLGAISDRSKELYFNKETVGQNLWKQIQKNRHTSLKNQVFYRQDYLDEFEVIWETQRKFYPENLTASLKEEIRDVVIFYQRKLKSQKGLLGFCQFESWQIDKTDQEGNILLNKLTGNPKKVTIGNRVIAKSSPLFQEFKVWQNLNNLEFKRKDKAKKDLFNQNVVEEYVLNEETRLALFKELNIRGGLTEKDILAALGLKTKEWKTNFSKGLEGNRTNEALFKVYKTIAQTEGYGEDWENKLADEIIEELTAVFTEIGVSTNILDFDAIKESATFDKQEAYQLWHLLYATEDDEKVSKKDQEIYGNSLVNLKKKLHLKYGFKPEYAKWMANVALQDDYGNLSSKAIRNIIPHLQAGNNYYEACALAGYNHSNSETKEEKENKVLLDKLDLLPKNSLRNPVVEKILNQMVNLINQVIKTYGKPDEVRIELARELKKSIAERKEMTANINDATKRNDKIKAQITKEFGIPNPTKTDVVRFRLWEELAVNGYKDVFTNVKIPKEKIFSKEIDIEHIVPKALLFDDSFSNKTLAFRKTNLQKGARTAFDFIQADYHNDLDQYQERVEALYAKGKGISKSKYKKLLISRTNLPEGFIERDLKNSQYIAKKAKAMLQEVFKDVVATSGSITNKLREDWGIVNVMKELNMPKYKALGLTEIQQRLDKGTEELKEVEVIKDWTKRNDHRHHAMDALTVAFTTHNHIQYINNLNTIASVKENDPDLEKSRLFQLKNTITKVYDLGNGKKKRKFIPPMLSFRKEAKTHIESILISFKNKNKVVTKNINKTKVKGGYLKKEQLTPRGQLHKETVYGKSKRIAKKPLKLTKSVTLKQLQLIVDKPIREVVVAHIVLFDGC